MAKALLGYSIRTDPRVVNRLAGENRSLRQRVTDLEDLVSRLQRENDALAAVATESVDQAARDASLATADADSATPCGGVTPRPEHRWAGMRILPAAAAVALLAGTILTGTPAQAHNDGDRIAKQRELLNSDQNIPLISSNNVSLASSNPSSAGISGCFMKTKPLFVQSNLDSVRVYDVSSPTRPALTGVLPSLQFENEAMNCGERSYSDGKVRRFALVGIDLVQASPGDIQHANAGGGELMIVDVTDPANPRVAGRAPGSTSTHTVACVQQTNCTYAYSAGDDSTGRFSIFDLRNLDKPVEVDSDPKTAGVQGFASPTAGHKWNFDDAGFGTHTGFDGASMWSTTNPRAPKLVTTTGLAGKGDDPKYPGWNDFILHNSQRPNAKAFRNGPHPRWPTATSCS